ncbi:MAG TPA: hypothetical protein H9867_04835 [Candidatus Corynebacterium gallistercoris]|uniref:Uncharacterized protein n=1 Tax=Candidatus Corynebacterium gallistercoris TaxID=2838530 RepID=A0A9D1RWW8_9CORY|nr:hypothetical protein [Candidatus Corynebacterium gallistercoris]
MGNVLTLSDGALTIEPTGLDKLWSFTRRIDIPWDHVRGATHDPGMKTEPKGWRGPGLRFRQKLSGTFHAEGERQFWNVDGFEDTVVIELRNERFTRIVVSLQKPAAQATEINARAKAR